MSVQSDIKHVPHGLGLGLEGEGLLCRTGLIPGSRDIGVGSLAVLLLSSILHTVVSFLSGSTWLEGRRGPSRSPWSSRKYPVTTAPGLAM